MNNYISFAIIGTICKLFGIESGGIFRKKQYLCGVIAAEMIYEIRI